MQNCFRSTRKQGCIRDVLIMAPSWKLGEVSREAAEDVVNSVQPPQDGTFAIRERGIGHVLCVVYRGRPTHHLIEKVDGQFSINKKTYGNTASTLEELVEYFKKPQTGWPVLLREPPQKIGDTSEKVDPRKRSSSMSASMKVSFCYFRLVARGIWTLSAVL